MKFEEMSDEEKIKMLEEKLKKGRDSSRKYYEKNKEAMKKKAKEWHKNNPKKVKESQIKWIKNNPDKLIKYRKTYIVPFDIKAGDSVCILGGKIFPIKPKEPLIDAN